jgi:hypothetical protein
MEHWNTTSSPFYQAIKLRSEPDVHNTVEISTKGKMTTLKPIASKAIVIYTYIVFGFLFNDNHLFGIIRFIKKVVRHFSPEVNRKFKVNI